MKETSTPERLTVSVVTGLVVERDAISNICRQQIEEIDRYAHSQQIPLDLKLFLHGTNVPDLRTVKMSTPKELACHPHYQKSNLVLFHFGIYYPIFDALPAAPRSARLVVNYYGITPPALASADSHDVLHRSFRQATHLLEADRVLVNSRFIRDEALAMGIRPERLDVLPLPAAFPIPDHIPLKPVNEELRIAYLGRIVPAKGIAELMGAMKRFAEHQRVHLTLMGARLFSSPALITEIEEAMRSGPLVGKCELLLDRPGAEVRERLATSDLFVMPSHHEGFCVPVIEAMSCGAGIICTSAGALPETSGGLGQTYPAGDADALYDRLCQFAKDWSEGCYSTESGAVPREEWVVRAAEHLQTFRRERFRDNFLRHALSDVRCPPMSQAELISESRVRAFLRLSETSGAVPEPGSIGGHIEGVLARAGQRRRRIPKSGAQK